MLKIKTSLSSRHRRKNGSFVGETSLKLRWVYGKNWWQLNERGRENCYLTHRKNEREGESFQHILIILGCPCSADTRNLFIGNVFFYNFWCTLVVGITRTRTRITTRTTIADRTRLGTIDGLAARNVTRLWWLWDAARISTTRWTGTFWTLVWALWWARVAATARSILTTSWTGATSWSAEKVKIRKCQISFIICSQVINEKGNLEIRLKLRALPEEMEVLEISLPQCCDDLERHSWSPGWRFHSGSCWRLSFFLIS